MRVFALKIQLTRQKSRLPIRCLTRSRGHRAPQVDPLHDPGLDPGPLQGLRDGQRGQPRPRDRGELPLERAEGRARRGDDVDVPQDLGRHLGGDLGAVGRGLDPRLLLMLDLLGVIILSLVKRSRRGSLFTRTELISCTI